MAGGETEGYMLLRRFPLGLETPSPTPIQELFWDWGRFIDRTVQWGKKLSIQ